MIEDGDLLKEEVIIGSKENDWPFTIVQRRNKLTAIKEVYRKFRSCLKGEARDNWLKLVEEQPMLDEYNYAANNTFGVQNFKTKQKN